MNYEPLVFNQIWSNLKTTSVDQVYAAWKKYKKERLHKQEVFEQFIEQLKRRLAIETGVIENLYSVSRKVTELLIKDGFSSAILQQGDSNVENRKLLDFINDNKESIDFVFDVVKDESSGQGRKLSVSFIKELHQLVTRSQDKVEALDQFGKTFPTDLLKGEFKKHPNNPRRPDGSIFTYCPPDFVHDEMEKLMEIYGQQVKGGQNPVILAAWFHHAFTVIHPFQDGNGRLARLLASFILIKHDLFPFNVNLDQKKTYIEALEAADNRTPQDFVSFIANNQAEYIKEAMNLETRREPIISLLAASLGKQFAALKDKKLISENQTKEKNRKLISSQIITVLEKIAIELEQTDGFPLTIKNLSGGEEKSHYYTQQITEYAKSWRYFFKANEPREINGITLRLPNIETYKIIISSHHFGYGSDVWALGSFMFIRPFHPEGENLEDELLLSRLNPFTIGLSRDSIPQDELDAAEKHINAIMAEFLTDILNRLG